MCWPQRKYPTNQNGQATRLWLCHCQEIQTRVFHITWFCFWLAFFGWFGTSNLFPQIQQDLGLTPVDKAIAGGCSVASTVAFRVMIGWLCDKIGSKKSYVSLLLVSAFPVAGMALVQTSAGYIVVSLCIGVVGAAFVITQYHTTRMYAGKIVGTANATSAGWGNFGGGCANFFMPILYNHFRSAYGVNNSTAWRLCMVVPAATYVLMAVVYWLFTVDLPPKPQQSKSAEASAADAQSDDIINKKATVQKGKGQSAFKLATTDYRTYILFLVYAACFGMELTVLRFTVGYLMQQHGMDQSMAGFIILCFSLCNLFARSIGGIVADVVSRYAKKSLNGRVFSLFIILLVESVFLIMFSFGAHKTWIVNLGYTIFTLIMFSLCVQAAEGATFAIVPFVQPKAIGPVAGIVGAGGNMGAMLFAFAIFTSVPEGISWFAAWLVLGFFVFCVSWCTLCIKFTDEEIRAADETMATWTEIEKNQGQFQKLPQHDNETAVIEVETAVNGQRKNANGTGLR